MSSVLIARVALSGSWLLLIGLIFCGNYLKRFVLCGQFMMKSLLTAEQRETQSRMSNGFVQSVERVEKYLKA
jgi:hypothetical protein